ncbi:MAG: NAD(P)H-hydrate dehydratase [Desulfurococcaceae archaeon]|nr:NAD(P)H-hydrate dehydratase [Desulfurococcaceae archaeon]
MWRFKVCSVEEMRWIDEEASRRGIDHAQLMENAGSAVFSLILRVFGVRGKKFTVLAGTGNNGGDALVAARRIHAHGGYVEVFIIGDPGKYREPARRNYELACKLGIPVRVVSSESGLADLEKSLQLCDVVVVGLIGTGLRGEVTGLTRLVIEAVNKSSKPVVSVDIASGVDGNSGRVRGVAVKSTYTVTLGLPKYGNVLYPGYYYCGKLYTSRLSYPPDLLDSENITVELNTPVKLPERVKWGHKGTFGKLLVVAGARYYYGAPYYSSYSFLKAGGGYSRLATPISVVSVLAAKCSEVVYHPMEETEEGTLAYRNYERVLSIIAEHGVDIVVLGPGTSLNSETQDLIRALAESIEKPVIIDGDGLTAISKSPEVLKKRKAPTVLTPHPVEFTRLTGLSLETLQEDPIGSVKRASRELNSYIVLKGAHSLIANPDGRVYVNMTGNPGMAKAGMGDVLNGAIAAMYGIGLRDLGEATRMGVLVHGLAGDLVAEDIGEDGVTPDSVLDYLPRAVRLLRGSPERIVEKYMPGEI